MPSLVGYGPVPPQVNPLVASSRPQQGNNAAVNRSQTELETQIARQVANAAPGANVNVQYSYAPGADGQLVVSGATVTVTESAPRPLQLGGTGEQQNNRLATIEDIVDISEENGESDFGLSAGEREVVRQLQAADAAIRRHEGLHFRAAGGLGSSPEYQTVQGPDGNYYAVAGSVGVSGTSGASPEKAAREAQTLELAATAPGDASAQDIAAARQFAQQGAAASRASNDAEENTQKNAEENQEAGSIMDLFA